MAPRTRRALLALYPVRWRRRYGEELLGFLDDESGEGRLEARAVADLATSALVERAHGAFESATPSSDGGATRGLRLLTWGWCCCVVGGIGFAKLSEHFATSAVFLPRGVPSGLAVAGASFDVVQWVAVIAAALVALLVAPAVLVAAANGGRGVRRRLGAAAALATGVSALAGGWLAWLVVWAHELSAAQRNGGSLRYGLAVVGLAVLCGVALAAWTSAANVALREVVPSGDSALVTIAARAAAACVVVVAAGGGLWLVAVAVDAPGFLGPGFGSNASSFASQWPFVLGPEVLLVAGAVLAVAGGIFATPTRMRRDAAKAAA